MANISFQIMSIIRQKKKMKVKRKVKKKVQVVVVLKAIKMKMMNRLTI